MDQLNYIFNNDARGMQYFLINTNNFTDFKLTYLENPQKTIYDELRDTLEKDIEYIDFENAFLFKLYILKYRKNIKVSIDDDIFLRKMDRKSLANDKFHNNIIDFLENSLSKKLHKLKPLIDLLPPYNIGFDIEKVSNDKIPNWVNLLFYKNPTNKNYFDAVDTWLKYKIKGAWNEFKTKEKYILNLLNKKTQEAIKYTQLGGGQSLQLKSKVDHTDLGLKSEDIVMPIFHCLLSSDEDFLDNCILELAKLPYDSYDQESIFEADPEIVLILLNKLGFVGILTDEGIKIINIEYWIDYILPKKFEKFNELKPTEKQNIHNYLSMLVNFINSEDTREIIEEKKLIKNLDKDVVINGLIGKDMDNIDILNVAEDPEIIPPKDLIKFYEFRRANNFLPPSTTKDLMRHLFLYNNFNLPDNLQIGGSGIMKPEDIQKILGNGMLDHKYLHYIFGKILGSLKNVTIDPIDHKKINNLLDHYGAYQKIYTEYISFLTKLKQINDIFIGHPNRLTLKEEDTEELQKRLQVIMNEFKKYYDEFIGLIESLKKRENDPSIVDSYFDN